MKRILAILVALNAWNTALAQDSRFIMSKGDSVREAGDLEGAIAAYRAALPTSDRKFFDYYNTGCAYSLLSMQDSALHYIRLANRLSPDLTALSDPDLYLLHRYAPYAAYEDSLVGMVEAKSKKIILKDRPLAKQLLHMYARDQAFYADLKIARRDHVQPSVIAALWRAKEALNGENRREFLRILETNGWPKISAVGRRAADAAFLVVQHWDGDAQAKYLPVIEALCKQGEASWQSYALMYDRLQVDRGMPQRYGSQVRTNPRTGKNEFFPIENEKEVDKRRTAIGMEPIAAYAKDFEIEYVGPR